MKILGNLIWLIFGGIIIAIEYFIGSLILMITIIGIPFGLQTLKMAGWRSGHSDAQAGYSRGHQVAFTYS